MSLYDPRHWLAMVGTWPIEAAHPLSTVNWMGKRNPDPSLLIGLIELEIIWEAERSLPCEWHTGYWGPLVALFCHFKKLFCIKRKINCDAEIEKKVRRVWAFLGAAPSLAFPDLWRGGERGCVCLNTFPSARWSFASVACIWRVLLHTLTAALVGTSPFRGNVTAISQTITTAYLTMKTNLKWSSLGKRKTAL